MPKFIYRAVNKQGRPIRGVSAAAHERDLGTRLEENGLVLIDCKEVSEKPGKLWALTLRKIPIRDLIQVFVHLEQMQKTGIPLLQSLADVRDTTHSTKLRDIISDVRAEVAEGTAFSVALGKHPAAFDKMLISLISAAEETGDLTHAYLQILKHLKWKSTMQSRIKKATRYPKVLLVTILGAIGMMMTYVVPQVAGFLHAAGGEMPAATMALLATSKFVAAYFLHILGSLVTLYLLVIVGRNVSEAFRYWTDYVALSIPVIGMVLRKVSLSQFSQTFAVLTLAGVDILRCLDAAKLTTGNMVIMDAVARVRDRVQEGVMLSKALELSGEFPSRVINMVNIGEQTGNLPSVLEQIAEFYDQDVDEAVDAMIQMIEPALTVVLGGIVVWVVAAVFGPIYNSMGSMDM